MTQEFSIYIAPDEHWRIREVVRLGNNIGLHYISTTRTYWKYFVVDERKFQQTVLKYGVQYTTSLQSHNEQQAT